MKTKTVTVSAAVPEAKAMELLECSIVLQRSVRQLAGFAIDEWLARNRNILKKKNGK